jgi:hypothetical protein
MRTRHDAGDESKENAMNQYLLSIYQPEGATIPPPHVLQAIMRDVNALRQEMKKAGVWVFSGGLHEPSTATVVRIQDGQLLTTDGPFAEGKEHIGGFSIVRAADLDAALEWGSKLARATTLPIEVRPIQGDGSADV